MYDYDSSETVKCQVCIISPGLSCAWADRTWLGKLFVIFGLVSHLVRGRAVHENLSALDICLLGPRGRFFANRPSHVRLFSIILNAQTLQNGSAHMCGFVESPSGIETELPWRLRYAHGAPALHSKFTVSQLYPPNHLFIQSEISSVCVSCIDIARVCISSYSPGVFRVH